jgi:hypothetical protein
VPCSSSKDNHGTTYNIGAAEPVRTPGSKYLLGCPPIDVWWSRSFDRNHAEETLVIRQEYADRSTADVLELTLGQVYDLIDALNRAVENL